MPLRVVGGSSRQIKNFTSKYQGVIWKILEGIVQERMQRNWIWKLVILHRKHVKAKEYTSDRIHQKECFYELYFRYLEKRE